MVWKKCSHSQQIVHDVFCVCPQSRAGRGVNAQLQVGNTLCVNEICVLFDDVHSHNNNNNNNTFPD